MHASLVFRLFYCVSYINYKYLFLRSKTQAEGDDHDSDKAYPPHYHKSDTLLSDSKKRQRESTQKKSTIKTGADPSTR